MDFALDTAVFGWSIAYALIALIVPYLLVMFVLRLFGRSTKKTYRAIKR